MSRTNVTIWDKIDESVIVQAAISDAKAKKEEKKRSLKRRIALLDFAGAVIWLYLVVKVFIFDLDRYLLERYLGDSRILNFKFFIFLAILALVTLLARRRLLYIGYVAVFPLVILLWKVPLAIYRTRSWAVFLAVANIVANFVKDFKYNVVSKTIAIIAALAIAVSSGIWILVGSSAVLLIYMAAAYYRVFKASFVASRFIAVQKRAITMLSDGTFIATATAIDDELRSQDVVKFDGNQLAKFTTKLANAILFNRLIYYWAYQMDAYRRSNTGYLFGTLSYVSLFVQTVTILGFVNFALFKLDPANFSYDGTPGFLQFILYSLSSLFVNSIDALEAQGDWAVGLRIMSGVIGPLLLTTLVLNWILTARQSKQDIEFESTVYSIKRMGVEFERRFREEYGVSVDSAWVRLQRLSDTVWSGAISYLTRNIPDDFFPDDGDQQSAGARTES